MSSLVINILNLQPPSNHLKSSHLTIKAIVLKILLNLLSLYACIIHLEARRQLWEVSSLVAPVNGIHQACLGSCFPTEPLQPSIVLIRSTGFRKKLKSIPLIFKPDKFLHHSEDPIKT